MNRIKPLLTLLVLAISGSPAWAEAIGTDSTTPAASVRLTPLLRWEPPIEPQTLTSVTQQQAKRYAQPVTIFAGRNSAIEFRTGERIQFLQISDPALMTFNTNAPVASGQATVIVLRLIRPIRFPGLISTRNPNLTVTTDQGTYFFNLQPSYGNQPTREANGVAIVSGEAVSFSASGETTIETRQGQATVEDIRRGLTVAIQRGYSQPDDPVVAQVQRAIVLMRRGASLPEIADATASPTLPAVLVALGELGIESDRANDRQGANSSNTPSPVIEIPVPAVPDPTLIPSS